MKKVLIFVLFASQLAGASWWQILTRKKANQALSSAAWNVINTKCVRCHGNDIVPGDVHLVGNLDLRTRASILAGGNRGPALVPGNPSASLIFLFTSNPPSNLLAMRSSGDLGLLIPPSLQDVANINALDAQLAPITAVQMPPPYPLTQPEIVALRKWIAAGAP